MGALAVHGVIQSLATVPSHWQGWEDNAHLRLPIYYFGVACGYVLVSLLLRRRPTWKVVPWALAMVIIAFVSLKLVFYSMDQLHIVQMVSMVYPIGTGTSITLFALYSLLIIREPARPLYVVAMCLGAVGVALSAIK